MDDKFTVIAFEENGIYYYKCPYCDATIRVDKPQDEFKAFCVEKEFTVIIPPKMILYATPVETKAPEEKQHKHIPFNKSALDDRWYCWVNGKKVYSSERGPQ